jgi:outer membrane protein assembly factor BamB
MRHARRCAFAHLLFALCVCAAGSLCASELLKTANVPGGLCVVLGCGDGTLAAELAADSRFIIHGLDSDAAAIAAARKSLQARGMYGQISVEEWNGASLPYADNVVNLVVVEKTGNVAREEMLRVLCPGGVVCANEGGQWTRTVKPRPKEMDEWTHWRHGPDRNPVSKDLLVEVPKRIQWLSYQGKEGKDMVSAGGRNFYAVSGVLRARDAFNGLPLWECPVDGKWRPVASHDSVFALTKGKLRRLDAATGREKATYPEAGSPAMVLHVAEGNAEGLLVTVDDRALRALDAASGKLLWQHETVTPRAVCIGERAVFLVSGNPKAEDECAVRSLDLAKGTVRWERNGLPWARSCYRACYGNGTVALETGRFTLPFGIEADKTEKNSIHFLAAADGRTLKDYDYMPAMRHDENPRAFFVGGAAAVHRMERDKKASSLVLFNGFDKEPEVFPALPPSSHYFYCYPPVATERFFIYGQMSFTDWKTHEHTANQITRGSCGRDTEGVIPANGLVYVFPKSCNCFSMLHGTAALAPAYKRPIAETQELVKGPAYGTPIAGNTQAGDWPVYRGDEYRSGSTAVTAPAKLQAAWSAKIAPPSFQGPALDEWKQYAFAAGPLTPPVIAGGLVFVAQPHTHRVLALDAADGAVKWEFVANGRVDSAPAIHDGLCLFGSRSGWVYCLRAADGVLVWRLRVAPSELRIVHCGQLESPWPVAGSVLISGGVAYFCAGMHPLADGGLRVFALDPKTGAIKWSKTVTDMGYNEKGWHARAGLEQDFCDLLVKDGERVALSRWVFDRETGQNEFLWHNAFYRIGKDGAYMQRGTWSYGYPMNRPRMHRPLLVGRDASVFGANKCANPKEFAWKETDGAPRRSALKLFRRDFKAGEPFNVQWEEQANDTESRIGLYFPANRLAENVSWASPYPGWIEAMVLAGENLFVFAQGKLQVYGAADGKLLHEMPLTKPVWDGIAAADGRLYVTTMDGTVLCLAQ